MKLCECCEEQAATVRCVQCHRLTVFCDECDGEWHRPGHLSVHNRIPYVELEEDEAAEHSGGDHSGCYLCDDATVSVKCLQCENLFCNDCDADFHKPAKMHGHQRVDIDSSEVASSAGVVPAFSNALSSCYLCDDARVAVDCLQCAEAFCATCDTEYHKPVKMHRHRRMTHRKADTSDHSRARHRWKSVFNRIRAVARVSVHFGRLQTLSTLKACSRLQLCSFLQVMARGLVKWQLTKREQNPEVSLVSCFSVALACIHLSCMCRVPYATIVMRLWPKYFAVSALRFCATNAIWFCIGLGVVKLMSVPL
jgi:hypothetical protein